ncbi:GTPase [Streptomyces caatingaensis]|uniref:ATP-binding protein n=1 Tax=Streptomyces caatingaensis TaxID=1678637 RepID=A0A0K9X9Z5_9ACTN|nr:GTPase [Streptomyces caatingaensis]KNB49477.1 ATP-binding protein [Streptomyces caatingaensis]
MTAVHSADSRCGQRTPPASDASDRAWDDGLIARRARTEHEKAGSEEAAARPPQHRPATALGGPLLSRLDALRELVGLSRARLDGAMLAEAGRVLEEAAARQRHSLDLTVVAIAGSTGSGKSTLFNALARAQLSEAGVRRPTTAAPVACAFADRADGMLDRLGVPARSRRQPPRPYDPQLAGVVLLDLPDHDSAAAGHREQVDRLLGLVDAVIWVVDPEKYADAVLHERYLRPLAGYAEVTFVVLNQLDRLSADAVDQVLDDLRRLLDEDGLALGEHGEPGATVLALSALTGEGVGELRDALGQFAARRCAAELRLTADVDGASRRLRPAYVADGRPGLTDGMRLDFEDRLAEAVGARASGLRAERTWLRGAERACGTVWGRAWRTYLRLRDRPGVPGAEDEDEASRQRRTASRPLVEQAVRTLVHEASAGLPGPWAQAVREAAVRGAVGLAEALDEAGAAAPVPAARREGDTGGWRVEGRRPGWGGRRSGAWRTGAWRTGGWRTVGRRTGAGRTRGAEAPRLVRPRWWAVALGTQVAFVVLQLLGAAGLVAALCGALDLEWWIPGLVAAGSGAGAPVLAWGCRMAARGPARGYGLETERRLRGAAASLGRERVLEPVAAELLRYREVRAQFVVAAGEM